MNDASMRPRHMRSALVEAMTDTPVVCLLGPRQSGKSTLARQLDPRRAYYSLDDPALLQTAAIDPTGFLAVLPERVTLDEIQHAPNLLPAIKLAVDRDRQPGRFLLTGSANLLLLPRVSESLAGRMEIVRLHPLTEAEIERQPGGFLRAMLDGGLTRQLNPERVDPMRLVRRVVRGGYPEGIRARSEARLRKWHRDYLDALVQRDAMDVARLRDVDQLGRLLETLALQTATLLNVSSLSKHLGVRHETIENHFAALERLFVIRRLPAWHRNPARRLVKAAKVHVTDSGLAASLAGLGSADWLTQRERFGRLLESFVVQQLVAQAGWTDPDVRFWHYRDKDQVEVDVVLTHGTRTWGVEVKTSATPSLADMAGLRRLAAQCGEDFAGGVLFHAGAHTMTLDDSRFRAVPLAKLWEM